MTGITARVGADAFVRPATEASVLRYADYSGVFRRIDRCHFGRLIRFLRESRNPVLRLWRVTLSRSWVALGFRCDLRVLSANLSHLASTNQHVGRISLSDHG